ncbi:LytR/AlgR family response regulator transcription factor [Jeotgalibacillus terrae]|uniref:LytR/AlgR family response regulator transcription factor n=1 Tax=Jeotgalibacillus terrae TaxID=587735 RepID=A0ABW5ZG58_9BACL|nr:LytTR family DNA-binding domain-containing protein [Jeotgalibacillus terrae]MBM7579535.1 two-component system response regulator LytT [Jeotgalibacillus terrae]
MEIRAVIIDDEPLSRQELLHLLKVHSDILVIGEAPSAEKGMEMVLTEEPDVLFLDIEMTGMNGVELAEALQKMKKPPAIIFATAYPDYAVKAFRVEAVDYLLKPFDENQLDQAISRLKLRIQPKEVKLPSAGRLAVQSEDRIIYLEPGELLYVYREGRDTFLVSEKGTYPTKSSLKDLENKLKPFSFFRVHKGYLVNIKKVEELVSWSTNVFELKVRNSEKLIPVSRNYVKDLRETLEL